MFKVHVCVFEVFLLIMEVWMKNQTKNQTETVSNVALEFLKKFHQKDYNITFEWAEGVRVNERYGGVQVRAFKYNRTCTAANMTMFSKKDLGKEMEMIIQGYKFASNEYRLFPMRFEVNLCQTIETNCFGNPGFLQCGNFSCPILKEKSYHICNWTPAQDMFPPYIPNGRYKLEVQGVYRSEEVFVQNYYGTVSRSIV